MSRHHLINADLDLFFNVDAKEFKQKISSRVYSPWKDRTNEKRLRFIHMLLDHVIKEKESGSSESYDWKELFSKLQSAGYKFTSSDYFTDSYSIDLFDTPLSTTIYLDMVKELHIRGVLVEKNELVKFLKDKQVTNTAVTDFFSSIGFDLAQVLVEISIELDISTLIDSNYEKILFNKDANFVFFDKDKAEQNMKNYQQEQKEKSKRINHYLDITDISEERARELYKAFEVSYDKMETVPEFKGKYHGDICISYHCSNKMKTDAFYTDIQIDLIRYIEEKANIQLIGRHEDSHHDSLSANAQKRPSWA